MQVKKIFNVHLKRRRRRAVCLVADGFHTNKLRSRLPSSEVRFQATRKRPFCVFKPPLVGLGATYDIHLRLIGKRVVDFLLVLTFLAIFAVLQPRYYERILTENWRFRCNSQLDPKFQVVGFTPTNHSSFRKTRINDLSYGIIHLTACLDLVGKHPVESDLLKLKSTAMNGASSPWHGLISHVAAVSSRQLLLGTSLISFATCSDLSGICTSTIRGIFSITDNNSNNNKNNQKICQSIKCRA